MAKKGAVVKVRLVSEEGPEYTYYTTKGRNITEKMRFRKYHPALRKHVWFVEKKMPPHKKN